MAEEPLPPYGSPGPAPEPGGTSSPVPRAEQHLMILGGLRRSGRWSVPARMTVTSLIGGVSLDLRDADLPAGEVELQHFSLVGGVRVVLPGHVGVRIDGLRLIGGQRVEESAGPFTTTLVIRSFGILGGVRVQRA